ncbi:MAG: ATP-binding cassette domain-containing protein [Oscillospiraceae bacterium]|nr:ATP-binding cassette domain-containing protein [Oscillospiraceae bacterium]
MENNEKKVLLQISNLKQYFPVGKNRFVKANDGISIDIYEGETFGLVGESGCGKSTLGRSILQLYKQTDGRTMYFGRSIDEVAPKYARDTFRTLTKRRELMKTTKEKYEAFKAEYDKKTEQEQYAMNGQLVHLRKEANDAMLDVTTLIGGLIVAPDLKPVEKVFLEEYNISKKLRKAEGARANLKLNVDDAAFALKKAEKAGKSTDSAKAKLEKATAKLEACENNIQSIHDQIQVVLDKIAEMRKQYCNEPGYDEYEAHHSNGIDLARLTYSEMRGLRSDLQLIFQDPYSSLNSRMTVGQIVGEGMLAHKYFRRNDDRMKEEIIRVMEECGLAPYFLHRYPHQFSGGQRQRIGIARSLALNPKFVVCDEAVSALDVSIQAQIINLLQDLKEKQNLTYLFITHDLSVVKYISDRIGVMYLGNMVEMAPSDDMFAHPLHPYTEALLNAIPTTDEKQEGGPEVLEGDIPSPVNPPKGCKFHTRCKYCTEICKQVVPQMEEVRPNHFVACHHILEHNKD